MPERPFDRVSVIDTHTGGEPTRVVVAGGPDLDPGSDGGPARGLSRSVRRLPISRGQRAARIRRDGGRPDLRAGESRVRGGRDLFQ